jgi:hypothetical protein
LNLLVIGNAISSFFRATWFYSATIAMRKLATVITIGRPRNEPHRMDLLRRQAGGRSPVSTHQLIA